MVSATPALRCPRHQEQLRSAVGSRLLRDSSYLGILNVAGGFARGKKSSGRSHLNSQVL